MAQTAFILILPSDEARGRRLDELLRERHGHSCRVVSTVDDGLNSIRARPPDVVVAVTPIDGRDAVTPLAELLDSLAQDATLPRRWRGV